MHIQVALIFSLFIFHVVSQSDSISRECRQQISDFLSVCDANNALQDLQGFQNQLDGSLAMCCYNDDCCSRLDLIKDCLTCDFAGDTDTLDINLLQSLSYHSTICQSEFSLPECFVQQSQDQAFQDRCALQSFNLVLECGFLAQTGNQKENGFSCCWPTECCEKAQNLLSSECNSDCATDQATPIKTFGNTIARMWRKVCLAPDNIETCSVSQVMSATTQQQSNSQVPRIVQQGAGQSGDGIDLNVQQVSAQVVDPQCMDIFDDDQMKNFQIVSQNLENFCGDTPSSQSDNIAIQNLCCDAIQQIVGAMCDYYACASQPAQFFDQSVSQLVRQWINPDSPTPVCPTAQSLQSTCDVANALNSVVSTPTPTPTPTDAINIADVVNIRPSNFNFSQVASVLSNIPREQVLAVQLAAFEQIRARAREQNWTTLELLGQLPLYAEFYAELVAMQLEDRLFGFPVTVFAINSTSLENIRRNIPEYFSSDWNRTILSHVVLGYTLGENFVVGMEQSVQTLAGYFVNVEQVEEDKIIVQGCCSEQNFGTHVASLKTSDGAFWIIDGNIYPPGVAEKIYN